jgi:hypothetical protein
MCYAPAAPAPPFLAPCAASASAPPIPTPRWPSPRLTTPLCHPPELISTAARRLCSPTGATSCSWQTPRVAPWPAATLVLPAVFFRTRHATPAIARAPPRPPRTPSTASTSSRLLCSLLDFKCVLELPVSSFSHPRTHICAAFPLPELSTSPDLRRSFCSSSTAATAAPHPRSSARAAPRQPTEAHKPAQFHSLALEQLDRSAGELVLSPPLGLAVVPLIHCLLALAKHTTSTTSSRGSYLATSLPPSYPPATGTPTASLGPPPPAPVRRRYTASVLLFPDTGHPRDHRESLNISPHLPLAVGEPPRRNLISTDQVSCVARPRTQLQRFKTFQGPFCRKSVPPLINQISQLVKSIGICRKIQKLSNQFYCVSED